MPPPRTDHLTAYGFARALLRANDLDPVYAVVYHAGFEPPLLRRWLLAYFCFYHVGTASWVADSPVGYWDRFRRAAGSKDYPRCRERRHFRGANATGATEWLAARGVDALFAPLTDRDLTAAEVIAHVKTWEQFGPWISFKVADMIDRVGLARVTFDADTAMYDGSPTEGALIIWQDGHPGQPLPQGQAAVRAAVRWAADSLLYNLPGELAPPAFDRPLGYQEVETCACKYKSYTTGHYRVGEDVESTRAGLGWRDTKTTRRLLAAGHAGGLW